LTTSLVKVTTGGQENDLQGKGKHDHCFVNVIVSGLKVVAIGDIDATHNFLSEHNDKEIKHKFERSMASFKGVNSTMKSTVEVIHYTPLNFGEWFGILDLMVIPLDDHRVIFGQDFMKLSKVATMPHENYLMFLDGNKTYGVPTMTRRKLGRVLRISAMKLIEVANEPIDKPCLITQ
jgi:hypothetical protein